MANILEYMDWRGDLDFSFSDFNEVDNLILAQLAYVDFAGIVPGFLDAGAISVKDASEQFFRFHDEKAIMKQFSLIKEAMYVLKKMAQTKRFCDARLFHYVNVINEAQQSQFSAMCISLNSNILYIAFRGTDNSLTGWHENFNMGFLEEIPGQRLAVKYLNQLALNRYNKIILGGHSKGGNLAVYAAVKCMPQIQNKISRIYNNDGPGFSHSFLEQGDYQKVIGRVITFLPESSLIGMLFEHEEEYLIVKSSNTGIMQHDAMSWEVLGAHFQYASAVTQRSLFVDDAMKIWLRQLEPFEKQELIETIFGLLEQAKIKTLDDFYHIKWKELVFIFRKINHLPEETQRLFVRAMRLLWKAGNIAAEKMEEKK